MDIFTLQIQTIKELLDWRVSLDIILLTLGIFYLYRTIKATGTWKIVLGIMFAAIIFILARLLDLKGITWIYSNLSQVLLLALIIIFQPELRKIFERAAPIKRKGITNEGSKLSFTISDVMVTLAQQNRGALLVLPGNDSIRPWVSEGIQIDAKPSFPLLMSIFDPHSPGHDGAAVIENGKISCFAIRLPLSKTGKLSDEYGTRHHAAMGLCEVTDAFVIAASEERGTISVFSEGTIEKITDKSELADKIMTHWQDIASYRLLNQNNKKQGKIFTQITLSFIMAFIFWSTVVLTQSELREVDYTVPFDYIAMPQNRIVVGEKLKEVKISLLGPTAELNNLNPAQLKVKIDLSKTLPGENIILISEDNIQLPNRIKLVDAEPSRLKLQIIEMEEVDAIIQPQLIGMLPEGLEIDSVIAKPSKVRVFAPVNKIKDKELTLMTTPIYLENVRDNTKIFCNLIAPPYIQSIEKQWPVVEIDIIIKILK